MKFINILLLLALSSAIKAEYWGYCLLFNVSLTLQDGTSISGWTDSYCFQNEKSKKEFVNRIWNSTDQLDQIINLYYYQDELEINPYTIKSNIGWIMPFDAIIKIPKHNLKSLKLNQIDSIPMGCGIITQLKKSDLNNLSKFSSKNSFRIPSMGDDSYTFFWSDSSAMKNELVLEVIDRIKSGYYGEEYLYKINIDLFKLGIIIENCRGD